MRPPQPAANGALERSTRPAARPLLFALALAGAGCGSANPASSHDVCAGYHFSDQGDVRAFVVGHRFQVDDAVSYDSYAASFRRHLASIKPCLSSKRPDLVVFPENSGLPALLIGSRGAQARQQSEVAQAFLKVLPTYNTASGYYCTWCGSTTGKNPGTCATRTGTGPPSALRCVSTAVR